MNQNANRKFKIISFCVSFLFLILLFSIFSKINIKQKAQVITAPLEKVGTDIISGKLEVMVKDDFDDNTKSGINYFIDDGKKKTPFILDNYSDLKLASFSGSTIKSIGYYDQGKFVGNIQSYLVNKQAPTNNVSIPVNHKVLTLLLLSEGTSKEPFVKSDAQKVIWNSPLLNL